MRCTLCIFEILLRFYFINIYIYTHTHTYTYTVVAKIIRTLVFSPAKNGFKSVISIFCCSVSVGNISLHFQTEMLLLIVIMTGMT